MRRLKVIAVVWGVLLVLPAAALAGPTIISGPDGDTTSPFTTTNTQPVFRFSESNNLLSNECRVTQDTSSSSGWAGCSESPGTFTSSPLALGNYTFQVRSLLLGIPNGEQASRPFSVLDGIPPAAPVITDTDPNSPSSDNSPEVKGTAEAGSNVKIYSDATCTGTVLATGTAAQFASPGLTANVPADATTQLRATATDTAGNISACSAAFAYTEDSTAPAAPVITDTDPNSPANDNNPEVKGTAEAGSTVKIYSDATCTGTVLATGTAAQFASPGLTVNLPSDATTQLRATATDAAGNTSACSAAFAYTEDSNAPAAPTITDTDPDSPSSDNSPEVKGTAEAGSTVKIYSDATCTGTVLASGTSAQFASPGLTVNLPSDATTQLRATATDAAGNTSACSAAFPYEEDSGGPATPSITDTDPNSPSNDNSPEVKGTAEAGTTVKIYSDATCTGTVLASGTAAQFASPGLTVNVPANQTTQLRATATDGASNTSACSAAFPYTEDSNAPAAPTITDTDPNSPANDNNPEVKGTAEAGSTVKIYSDATCTGTVLASGTAAQFASPGLTVNVPGDATTQLRATATDAAGNTSACSASFPYEEDSGGPATPSITDTDPNSPANDNSPEVKGTAEAGSTVRIYSDATCTGTVLASGTAAQFASPGLTVSLPADQTTQLRATATDGSNNTSDCSAAFAYTEDSTSPAAPSITDTDPNSPSSDNSPEVKGTAEAGSTVKIYSDATCTGTVLASGTAAQFASPGLTANVPSNQVTQLRATATDAAGNTSACSAAFPYEEDSGGPATPSITDTDPNSPANDNSPEVKGTAEAGSTVRIYSDATCTGTVLASGTAAQFASPGLTVNVPADQTTQLRATATDGSNNISDCSAAFPYTEDSNAPAAPTITDTDPNSPSSDNSPEVKGTAEAGTTVKIYSDATCTGTVLASGTAAQFASPGLTATVASDQTTDLRATATDAAGNASPCSAAFPYTHAGAPVDTTPPDTTITGAPASLIRNRTPSFTFDASESGVTYRCRLDSDQFAGCSSPFTTASLNDGTHTFQVAARDAADNQDPTPAEASFRVDGTAPRTRITKAPKKPGSRKGTKSAKGASFQFVADEGEVTFECRIDKSGYQPCKSPYLIAGIPNGKHIFRVRATDLVGNLGPAVKAKFEFRKKKGGQSGPPIPDPPSVDPCVVEPTIEGTPLAETLTGTPGPDVIHAGDGDDHVDGGSGDDLICGGGGNDDLNGGPGNDIVKALSGDDQLAGGLGNDSLLADEGNDRLEGMDGADLMYGSSGSDFLIGGAGSDFLDGGLGNDRCDGGSDKDSGIGCERATPF